MYRMINVGVIAVAVCAIILSFCIGYARGFKKSKEIDDEILAELGQIKKEFNDVE